jgi:hypothetical protein
MQLCFQNNYGTPVSIAVMWYDTGACGGDGGDWATRGWWNLNPGDSVHTNVWTANRYFCFYAEAQDGAVWAGPYVAEVMNNAFDGCINIGHSVSDGPNPYYDVGFRLEDAGWWFWSYVTYTVNLNP